MALKRPHAISFSKKNEIHPFEPEGIASLEFWCSKNDATFFVVGTSTKKRPNGLTLVRTFDGKVLDMCEVGVRRFVPMSHFKVRAHRLVPAVATEMNQHLIGWTDEKIDSWIQATNALCFSVV